MSVPASAVVAVDHAPDIGPDAFAIKIGDDSMVALASTGEQSFRAGDVVIIDPDQRASPGHIVLARPRKGEIPSLRKVRHRQGEDGASIVIDLVPLNPSYPVLTLVAEQGGSIYGRAVRHIRPL